MVKSAVRLSIAAQQQHYPRIDRSPTGGAQRPSPTLTKGSYQTATGQ